MEQAQSNPTAAGTEIPLKGGMNDPRWPGSDGWVKMGQNVNGVEIHYVRNVNTGEVADFKFK
jgi:filamentous hemagglutinin